MKQFTLNVLAIAVILGSSSVALAETSAGVTVTAQAGTGTGTTSAGIRADIKEIRENAQDKIKEMRADVKAQVQGKMAEVINKKIENRFEKMNKRFEATIDRLTNIMTRVKSRIEKIKNAGGNTTNAEKFVASAQVSLDLAKADLIKLQTASDTEITQENATTTRAQAKATLENMRKIAKSLEKNLQDTRVALSKAVGSLMGNSQIHATSTTSVESDNN